MKRFELELLGVPRVVRIDPLSGESIELNWRLRRALEILAFLSLAPGRRTSRDRLIEAIWPEADVGTIERNVHPTMSYLRKMLGESSAVSLRQGIYQLATDSTWTVDTERFREALRRSRLAEEAQETEEALRSLESAWQLYRGDFLTGWDHQWVIEEREALHRDWIDLLVRLAEFYTAAGRQRDALDAYRSVLLREPYEERLHVAVMEIYAQQKRRDLVRKQYLSLRESLGELGVEPLSETEELFHRLMR